MVHRGQARCSTEYGYPGSLVSLLRQRCHRDRHLVIWQPRPDDPVRGVQDIPAQFLRRVENATVLVYPLCPIAEGVKCECGMEGAVFIRLLHKKLDELP